jgi:hypothetical protein
MKKLFYLSLMAFLVSFTTYSQSRPSSDVVALQKTFTHISDSVQTSIYWYWIDGNISKEGVVKDLEAMKKVGINRAFIGNIGLDENSKGKVKLFSDEWWDILHTTLKTATRLNIEIGIFNGPGWSQSGGPWIKPEQSMRYLTSSQTLVHGPLAYNKKLAKPQEHFQDVKVLAYPVAGDYATGIGLLDPAITAEPVMESMGRVMDRNPSTAIPLAAGKPFSLSIDTKDQYTARSLTITTTDQNVRLEGDLQAKVNNAYVNVKHFVIDRTNSALNVGFIPFGPAAFSFPATTSNSFRVMFTGVSSNSGIAEIDLSATPKVENYMEKTLAKMWPTPHPFWDAYQWAPQPVVDASQYVIDPSKVMDISKFLNAEGVLNWKVPAGDWVIERTGMVPTQVTNSPAEAAGRGLEVDKMSKEHIEEHFNAFLGDILKRIPAEDARSFKVAVEDSYETGGQNWTDDLIPDFKRVYHYDPTPYLPVLQGRVVGSQDKSDRFLWDLRRLIADDVSFKYVGGLREICHKHGLTTWLENYGHWGYPGEFLQYGGQSDELGGEFWSEGDLGDIENRAASSSAHIYGKTKVSAESFTAAGSAFARYPAMFKARGDRFFTEGVNTTLLHVYIQQPQDTLLPGATTWFGVEFNRLNTWFYDMDVFINYLKRCNMMLQQGNYVADAAYFIGEDAPKMIGVTDPPLPQGYSYDYINADVIKQRLTVSNGKLVLPDGMSYSVLVLPKLETMRPELLTKIKELVQQGAIVLGPRPTRSPSLAGYPASDAQVKSLASQLWGDIDGKTVKVHRYGKGMVIDGMDMQQVFDLVKVGPDLKITQGDPVLFIHRSIHNSALYFISNQKNVPVQLTGRFRITGKSPSIWNATDGSIRHLPAYKDDGETTSVPIALAPFESAFILFTESGVKADTTRSNYPTAQRVIEINQPWTVNFDPKMRGPVKSVVFRTLTDWSKNANDSIRYYSGTAYYNNTFHVNQLSKNASYVIDLGVAQAIAKVTVNGVEVGAAWTPPYAVDITQALTPGINQLQIKVVNTWVNRLVGDSTLPPAQRKTTVQFGPDPTGGLQPSGLLGPVIVKEVTY